MRERLACLGIKYSHDELREKFHKFWCVEMFSLLGINLNMDGDLKSQLRSVLDDLKTSQQFRGEYEKGDEEEMKRQNQIAIEKRRQEARNVSYASRRSLDMLNISLRLQLQCSDDWETKMVDIMNTCRRERMMFDGKEVELSDLFVNVGKDDVLNMYLGSIRDYASLDVWGRILEEDVFIQEHIFGGILDHKYILPFVFTMDQVTEFMNALLTKVNKDNVYESLLLQRYVRMTEAEFRKRRDKTCKITMHLMNSMSMSLDDAIEKCMRKHNIDTEDKVKEKMYSTIQKYYIKEENTREFQTFLKQCHNTGRLFDECRKKITPTKDEKREIMWVFMNEKPDEAKIELKLKFDILEKDFITQQEVKIDPLRSGGWILDSSPASSPSSSLSLSERVVGTRRKRHIPKNIKVSDLSQYFKNADDFKPIKSYFVHSGNVFVPRYKDEHYSQYLDKVDPELRKLMKKLCDMADGNGTHEQQTVCDIGVELSSDDDIRTLYGYACVVHEYLYGTVMPRLEDLKNIMKGSDLEEKYKKRLLSWWDYFILSAAASGAVGTVAIVLTPLSYKMEVLDATEHAIIEKHHESDAHTGIFGFLQGIGKHIEEWGAHHFSSFLRWYDEKMTEFVTYTIHAFTGIDVSEEVADKIANSFEIFLAGVGVISVWRNINLKSKKVKCDILLRQILDSGGRVPDEVMAAIQTYVEHGQTWGAFVKGENWYGDR